LAERIVRTVAGRLNNEGQVPLTVSTGYAVFPTSGRTTEGLISAVEDAVAEARQQGGNCCVRADSGPRGKGQPQTAAG
jgi:GGDEF domain-containing protein